MAMNPYQLNWPGLRDIPMVTINKKTGKVYSEENLLPRGLASLGCLENKYVPMDAVLDEFFMDIDLVDAQSGLQVILAFPGVKPVYIDPKTGDKYIHLSALLALIAVWPSAGPGFSSAFEAVLYYLLNYMEIPCLDCGFIRRECLCQVFDVRLATDVSIECISMLSQTCEQQTQTDGLVFSLPMPPTSTVGSTKNAAVVLPQGMALAGCSYSMDGKLNLRLKPKDGETSPLDPRKSPDRLKASEMMPPPPPPPPPPLLPPPPPPHMLPPGGQGFAGSYQPLQMPMASSPLAMMSSMNPYPQLPPSCGPGYMYPPGPMYPPYQCAQVVPVSSPFGANWQMGQVAGPYMMGMNGASPVFSRDNVGFIRTPTIRRPQIPSPPSQPTLSWSTKPPRPAKITISPIKSSEQSLLKKTSMKRKEGENSDQEDKPLKKKRRKKQKFTVLTDATEKTKSSPTASNEEDKKKDSEAVNPKKKHKKDPEKGKSLVISKQESEKQSGDEAEKVKNSQKKKKKKETKDAKKSSKSDSTSNTEEDTKSHNSVSPKDQQENGGSESNLPQASDENKMKQEEKMDTESPVAEKQAPDQEHPADVEQQTERIEDGSSSPVDSPPPEKTEGSPDESAKTKTHLGQKPLDAQVVPSTGVDESDNDGKPSDDKGWDVFEYAPTGEKMLRCLRCGQCFDCEKYAQAHHDMHSVRGGLGCPKCPYQVAASKWYILLRHLYSEHDERLVMEENSCNLCGLTFEDIEKLEQHVDSHHYNKYKCTHCGTGALTWHHLKHHLEECQQVDQGPLYYSCPYCHFAFRDRIMKQVHVKSHRGDTLVCCYCRDGKDWENWKQLKAHYELLHLPKVKDRNPKKAKKCPKCTSEFLSYKGYRNHVAKCSGQKPEGEEAGSSINGEPESESDNKEDAKDVKDQNGEMTENGCETKEDKKVVEDLPKGGVDKKSPKKKTKMKAKKEKGPVKCDKCMKKFSTSQTLERHQEYAHGPEAACDECDHVAKSKMLLK